MANVLFWIVMWTCVGAVVPVIFNACRNLFRKIVAFFAGRKFQKQIDKYERKQA